MGKDRKHSSSSSDSKISDNSHQKHKKKSIKKHKHHHQQSKENTEKIKTEKIGEKKNSDTNDWSEKKKIEELTADQTADLKIEKILERIKESNPVEPENPFKNKPEYDLKKKKEPPKFEAMNSAAPKMIEVVVNDRLGKKVRIKCCPDDTIGDLKKLIALQTGTKYDKIRLQKWYNIYKDHITLEDYEIHDGMGLEMYYN